MIGLVPVLVAANVGAQPARVAVAVIDPSAEAVARHIDALVGGGVQRLAGTADVTVESLRREGAAPASELVVLVDPRASALRVVRPGDGLVLERAFDGLTMKSAPYAAAVAAVELLEIARGTPLRTKSPAPPARAEARATAPPPAPARSPLSFAFAAGVSVARGLSSDLSLVQPSLGVEVAWRRRTGVWWGALGVRALPLGSGHRHVDSVDLIGRSPAAYDVTYTRFDGALRVAGGRNLGPLSLSLGPMIGFARITARATDDAGQRYPPSSDGELWWGAGVEGRVALWRGLLVLAEGQVAFTPSPAQYLARGAPAYGEGTSALRIGLGLAWETGSP